MFSCFHGGEVNVDVAATLNLQARLQHERGLLKEALVTHTHSLEIRRQVFGEVHEAVASTLNAMGAVYRDQGLASAAIDCFSQALQMYRQVHANDGGDNHPDCAMTMAAIRCVLQSLQEESAEEKEVARRANNTLLEL